MITMFLMFLVGFGILAVIISAAFKILSFFISLPVIGTLVIVMIIIALFFRL